MPMEKSYDFPLLAIPLRYDRHVVQARQRTRDLAAALGFEHQDQIRLATATSELARNAFRYAGGGTVSFCVKGASPQIFVISVSDQGGGIPHLSDVLDGVYVSKTGLGMGIVGTRRLMDHFAIDTTSRGTQVECGRCLPSTAPVVSAAVVKSISAALALGSAADPFDEIERQNQELLKTLADLKEKQEQLTNLNQELEDTNRGVVALYAELEQHADDLRRVSDLKTSFLSNLSHEFRTPLNSIGSLSRLLLAHTDGDLSAEQEKQVSFIQRSAAELSELVNDLLDLAKVEAGRVDIKPRRFDVDDFFGGLRGMLRPLLAGNQVDLLFEASPDLPTLFTDEGKVSQVLRNLISNALKFTKKGHILVTAEQPAAGWTVFRVADTGIGIATENWERIFEEFVQIEGELQSQVKGTGLGLPLSRKLAELLGGTLRVESVAGVGSTFVLQIQTEFGTSMPAVRLPQIQSSEGSLILFIEDNPETSFVHESALRNTTYKGAFVANLPDARIAMRKITPDLVILDRVLDEKDSLLYIAELRSQGYPGPILVVSVMDDPKSAMDAGATFFLAKPVPPFTLLNTIRELIDGRPSKTVLLVDDDEVTRYLVGGTLARAGFRIVEAHGGREALRLIQSESPDAIVLDIAMPDMTGFEVLREIRELGLAPSAPVVIHSSLELCEQEKTLLAKSNAFIYSKGDFSRDGGSSGMIALLEAAADRP
jgi:signal transduction histidine kinase/DNA-binding response OmpR family regulator